MQRLPHEAASPATGEHHAADEGENRQGDDGLDDGELVGEDVVEADVAVHSHRLEEHEGATDVGGAGEHDEGEDGQPDAEEGFDLVDGFGWGWFLGGGCVAFDF